MQVIILAAGKGSRLGKISEKTHKSLLPINGSESLLSHLLHQLNEYPISKLIVVVGYRSEDIVRVVESFQIPFEIVNNKDYEKDTNILSMNLALYKVNLNEDIVVFESDIYVDDLALQKIMSSKIKNRSIWFTRGYFKPNMNGGILKSDSSGNINEIKIVPEYEERYSDYLKLTGILILNKDFIQIFRKLVFEYCAKSIKQYYLIPWIQNLHKLPAKVLDLSNHIVDSFNTIDEYNSFIGMIKKSKTNNSSIALVELEKLLPIENYIEERVSLLKNEILNSDFWIKPIIVERSNNLILDGHHRFEVAKQMNLKLIPAIFVNYNEVKVWSLREEEYVNSKEVINRAKNKNIYPNKTVKHSFPFNIPLIKIKIENLK